MSATYVNKKWWLDEKKPIWYLGYLYEVVGYAQITHELFTIRVVNPAEKEPRQFVINVKLSEIEPVIVKDGKIHDGKWSDNAEEYWRKMGMRVNTKNGRIEFDRVNEMEALSGFPLKHLSSVEGIRVIMPPRSYELPIKPMLWDEDGELKDAVFSSEQMTMEEFKERYDLDKNEVETYKENIQKWIENFNKPAVYDIGLLKEFMDVANRLAYEERVKMHKEQQYKYAMETMKEGDVKYSYMGRLMSKDEWAKEGIDIGTVEYQASVHHMGGHNHITTKGVDDFGKELFDKKKNEIETIIDGKKYITDLDSVKAEYEYMNGKVEPKPYKLGNAYYTAQGLREQGLGEAVDQTEKKVKQFLDEPHKQLEKYRVIQTIIQNFDLQHESYILEYVFECLKWPEVQTDYKQWKESDSDAAKMTRMFKQFKKNEYYVQQKGDGPHLPDYDMEIRKNEVRFKFNGAGVKFTYPEGQADYVENALQGFKSMTEQWKIK